MATTGRPRGSRDRLGRCTRRVPISEPFVRYMREVGVRIRELREEQDVAASELAAALNVHRATVQHWESGIRTPTIANLYRISVALGVRVSDILEIEP